MRKNYLDTSGGDFSPIRYDLEQQILQRVQQYMNKHPMATTCGGEYIFQNDQAQFDALDLVSDLGEIYMKFPEFQIKDYE
jgi:hypothetical protein